MLYCVLSDRAVIAVLGADAEGFLQGLVSNDVRKAGENAAVFAALLTPQGKFLYDFFILRQEGGFLLETDKARLPDLQKRLSMYKLRAKVELRAMPQWQVSAGWGGAAPPSGGTTYADPRLADLGWRKLEAVQAETDTDATAYHLHRMALGVPEGVRDLVQDRSLPLEYGYDELNGIDFGKGCYVGQEVTARTKHRGALHKFIHIVEAASALPLAGTPVLLGAREAGTLCGSAGTKGLALLRLAEAARATAEEPLRAGGIALSAALPGWCRTRFHA